MVRLMLGDKPCNGGLASRSPAEPAPAKSASIFRNFSRNNGAAHIQASWVGSKDRYRITDMAGLAAGSTRSRMTPLQTSVL